MQNAPKPIDRDSYRTEIEALEQYLQRTSTFHAIIRLMGIVVMIAAVTYAFRGHYGVEIAIWAAVVLGLELLAYKRTQSYFRKGPAPLSEDGQIDGKTVTRKQVRLAIYIEILVPTFFMTVANAAPSLFLMFLPAPGPILGFLNAAVLMLNIAAQHTFRPSMPFITIPIPAIGLIGCAWAMSTPENFWLIMAIAASFLVQTLSITLSGVRAQRNLVYSTRKAENEAVARQIADEANTAKSVFLANMSHELRTPLNAIIGYSEMMMEDAEDEHRLSDTADHRRIIMAAQRLLLNINDILDFSKIEAGRLDTEIGQFDLRVMIQDAVDAVFPMIAEKPVQIKVTLPEDLPPFWSDRHRLEQCLLNLLSNAVKFTHEGEIEVRGYFESDSALGEFVLEIRDTGIGMSEDQLSKIFRPFVQADESLTREYGGTGLGLVITKHLMGLLEGSIDVESMPGKGSIFSLKFPVMTQSALSETDTQTPIRKDAPLVMIIDDDADVHELLSRDLKSMGFNLEHALSAEDGYDKLCQNSPSVIVLDLHLPGKSGYEFLEQLKCDPETSGIPVIIHSADCDRQTSIQKGAVTCLQKPARREDLIAELIRYARRAPGAETQVKNSRSTQNTQQSKYA